MSEKYPDGFTITKTYTVKESDHSDHVHTLRRTFDFSGCPLEKIADEALRSIIIKLQGTARRHLAKGMKPETGDVNVAETFRTGRVVNVAVTKETAIEFLTDNMTEEELIAELRRRKAERDDA